MHYKQFQTQILEHVHGSQVRDQDMIYGFSVVETVDGVYINNTKTTHKSLDDARTSLKNARLSETLRSDIHRDSYTQLHEEKIANIIKNNTDLKVTDKLIESYVALASSKAFSVDPVITEIKQYNTLDVVLEDHLDYVLKDGSKILISNRILESINSNIGDKEVIDFMNESKTNFFKILEILE